MRGDPLVKGGEQGLEELTVLRFVAGAGASGAVAELGDGRKQWMLGATVHERRHKMTAPRSCSCGVYPFLHLISLHEKVNEQGQDAFFIIRPLNSPSQTHLKSIRTVYTGLGLSKGKGFTKRYFGTGF